MVNGYLWVRFNHKHWVEQLVPVGLATDATGTWSFADSLSLLSLSAGGRMDFKDGYTFTFQDISGLGHVSLIAQTKL